MESEIVVCSNCKTEVDWNYENDEVVSASKCKCKKMEPWDLENMKMADWVIKELKKKGKL